jgi:hypothetical protein
MEQHIHQQRQTDETKYLGVTQCPLKEFQVLSPGQKMFTLEHASPVKSMLTIKNESSFVKLPVFGPISDNPTLLETKGPVDLRIVVPSFSSPSFSCFYTIITGLPEGHVQIKPLTYSGNDLSASMNF